MIILNNFKIPSSPSSIVKLSSGLFRLDDPAFAQPIDLEIDDHDITIEELSVFFTLIEHGKIGVRGAIVGDTSNFSEYKYSGQGNIFTGAIAMYELGTLPNGSRIKYFDANIIFARKYMLFAAPHLACLEEFGERCNALFNKRENTIVHAGYFDSVKSGRASTVVPASEFDITSFVPSIFKKFINGEL